MPKDNATTGTAVSTAVAAELATSSTFAQMERMAASLAKSGLFGVKNADQALGLMIVAHAEGRNPALVARDFDIIQGRPAKKSEAMLRDFHAAGGKVEWHELSDTKAEATFSHPQGGSIKLSWDLPRAEKAGLTQKDGSMYKKYPRSMLRSRLVSEGCRTVWPAATSGMYTPEEGHDIAEERDITPVSQTAAVLQAVEASNALTELERDEHFNAMSAAVTMDQLMIAFGSAWKHGSEAKDDGAKAAFKSVYEGRKAEIESKAVAHE